MRVDAALVTRSVFRRKLSLLQRLLELLIGTGKKKQKTKNKTKKKTMPETVLYTGHFSAPVSFSVLRFALASAVNTGIHSGQTVMQVNGQLVLYILYIGAILSRVSIENETGVERETPTRLSPALRTYVLT